MKRKIIRIGNSYGVIIPKNVMKVLGWDVRKLDVEINLDKREMIVKKK